jgi:hypothetical protein
LGYRAVYRNQSFKKTAKCGVIGVKCSLLQSFIQKSAKHGIKSSSSQSFIQKKHKTRDYRGKMQFTAIVHSKKSKNKRSPSVHCNRSFKKEQK